MTALRHDLQLHCADLRSARHLHRAAGDAARADAIAPAVAGVLADAAPRVAALAQAGFERVVYLGSGVLGGLAREAALKLLELTDGAVATFAFTPMGFRHGPKTILNARTLIVVFASNDRLTRRYDLDLVEELRRDGGCGAVLAVSAQRAGRRHHPSCAGWRTRPMPTCSSRSSCRPSCSACRRRSFSARRLTSRMPAARSTAWSRACASTATSSLTAPASAARSVPRASMAAAPRRSSSASMATAACWRSS